jgi:hypothetical protein
MLAHSHWVAAVAFGKDLDFSDDQRAFVHEDKKSETPSRCPLQRQLQVKPRWLEVAANSNPKGFLHNIINSGHGVERTINVPSMQQRARYWIYVHRRLNGTDSVSRCWHDARDRRSRRKGEGDT